MHVTGQTNTAMILLTQGLSNSHSWKQKAEWLKGAGSWGEMRSLCFTMLNLQFQSSNNVHAIRNTYWTLKSLLLEEISCYALKKKSVIYSGVLVTYTVVQSLSHVPLWDPMNCSTLGLPVRHHLPELTQTDVHWVGDAIQPSHLCHPLLPLPSIFPSIRAFSNE